MHTNAFRSLQDKAWKDLPRHKNVSSPPAAEEGGGKGLWNNSLSPPPISTTELEISGPAPWYFLALGSG